MNILTSQQAAEMLHCSPEHLEELARSGKIPATKLGRAWIYPEEVLNDFLKAAAMNNMRLATATRAPDEIYPAL